MISKTKYSLSLLLAFSLLLIQVGRVLASSALQNSIPVHGIVQSITLETDPTTGVTTVIIDVIDSDQSMQHIRVSLETAFALGLVALNGDGKPEINHFALGKPIEVDTLSIIPKHPETQHPVGSALATFFSHIAGVDYETIMNAHEKGVGFGVIAQTLWLTEKLQGNGEVFEALIEARQTGDYSDFVLEDGTTPKNWGQLRSAILDQDKKNSVGVVVSSSNGNENGNDKDNNGNGNGQGNNGDKGNDKGNDKDNGKDKSKDKDNVKDKKK